jgi:glutaredoxin-related protein
MSSSAAATILCTAAAATWKIHWAESDAHDAMLSSSVCRVMWQKVEFKVVNVAGNAELQTLFEEVSQEIQPSFSFPQIYAKGKLVSGLDMIKDMLEVSMVHLAASIRS